MRPQVHLDLYPNVNNLITDNHAFIKSRYLFLFSSLEYYLVHGIKPPNHQFCYPQFFHEYFSVLAIEKRKKNTFHWSKNKKKNVLDQKKFRSVKY